MITPAIRKRLVQIGLLVLIQAVLLFLSAGQLGWGAAWVYILLYIVFISLNGMILFPRQESREMIEERAQVKEGSKRWDKVMGLVMALFGPAILVVAGLDERFGWTGGLALWIRLVGTVVLAASYGLFAWAMASNKFFSAVVRIQKDRGHSVQTGGPYAYVRHPAYAAQLVTCLAIPLLLGSVWAYVPVIFMIISLFVRTALEDRTLQNELEGYRLYASHVRNRLIPGVW
jgi:protein-S-isoprenylcysteine O-methyltransferase Ste14